ncbi:hypothetical protein PR048_031817 [Dryococelus australis]|uniref:Glutathione S-transferase C-terminal domain-containing protein n=1 Tax=Dryococelus australis TaxID=614101 RepID=A0ABQ9G6Z2_9NEOP|nr:hypothetical protein PR048_031817 [Dryococelus australis]
MEREFHLAELVGPFAMTAGSPGRSYSRQEHRLKMRNMFLILLTSYSRAISAYSVDKYGKNDSLYPKDPKKKAKLPPADRFKDMEKSVGYLDSLLEGQQWVAGEDISIADYSLVVSVTVSEVCAAAQ